MNALAALPPTLRAFTIPVCIFLQAGWLSHGVAAERPYDRAAAKAQFVRPSEVPVPKDNALTAPRVQLGKALFFDPRLSGSNAISCASCHNPAFSWGDGLEKAVGHGSHQLGRRTPTILNTAFADSLFWDGRAESLEEQALGPIAAPGEMNQPLPGLVTKLREIEGYQPLFTAAYPGEGISEKTIAKAIASFERTVVSEKAPFDKWIEGQEDAISESAKHGFDLFNTKANCVKCHLSWNFTDNGFHDIGLASDDIGRGKFLPQIQVTQHAFKTPTLRNVEHRAPYMHDGSAKTMADVVKHYNAGGKTARPSLADTVKPLGLDAREIADLCEFMRTLTSQDQPFQVASLPNP